MNEENKSKSISATAVGFVMLGVVAVVALSLSLSNSLVAVTPTPSTNLANVSAVPVPAVPAPLLSFATFQPYLYFETSTSTVGQEVCRLGLRVLNGFVEDGDVEIAWFPVFNRDCNLSSSFSWGNTLPWSMSPGATSTSGSPTNSPGKIAVIIPRVIGYVGAQVANYAAGFALNANECYLPFGCPPSCLEGRTSLYGFLKPGGCWGSSVVPVIGGPSLASCRGAGDAVNINRKKGNCPGFY